MANIHNTTRELSLSDLISRSIPPRPWEEGDKIPWDDPGFSRRMLREHLTDRHDSASPRASKIDQHVEWIHRDLLSGQPTKVLDLGCGPGLYTSRLAKCGHECVGIDFGPASVEHARQQAEADGLSCRYVEEDLRVADWGDNYGLVMMLHGELNTFRSDDARKLVERAHASLKDDALILLAVAESEESGAKEAPSRTWFTAESGLFSDGPHVGLTEQYWDPDSRTQITRWYIIDVASGKVTRLSETARDYASSEYETLLRDGGFADIRFCKPLAGMDESCSQVIIVGRKAA